MDSHVSDGQVAPELLVHAALAAGLQVIALTDHDTVAGVDEAQRAAWGTALGVVPGIEVSTRHQGHELHILGYWVDPNAAGLQEHQRLSVGRRERRMHAMIERLHGLGVPVAFERVRALAGAAAKSLGRPHLARALLEAGHIRSFPEAFDRFLAEGKPGFVAEGFPSVGEAVEMIHAAGGVAAWAHPPLELFAEFIADFAALGMDGVECFRPGYDVDDSRALLAGAARLGLFPTGGSDWHGPAGRLALGDFYVEAEAVRELLARGAHA